MKSQKENKKSVSRRQFIGSSVAPFVGLGLYGKDKLFASETLPSKAEVKIKEYRTLGRTGFKASDIGIGSTGLINPDLFEAALDAGINYIDTAPEYARGVAESTIGKVIKNCNRKSIFITTKLGLMEDKSKDAFLRKAKECLKRLQTDYVDCLMIWSPETVEQLKTEGFHEAVRELKAEGRVRFCGIANHGFLLGEGSETETMEKVCLAAAEDGRFDVILFVYNFMQREQGEKILRACKEKDIGTTLMKVNPISVYLYLIELQEKYKKEDKEIPEYILRLLPTLKKGADQVEPFRKKYNLTTNNDVRDAAIKFVLNHPDVSSVLCSMGNYNDLEDFVSLSGEKYEFADEKMLSAYAATYGKFYCRHACGECESQCPHGVPVNTIMRYNHYFTAQGMEKTAMVKYAALKTNKADLCLNCSGQCEKACRYGVPAQAMLVIAHQTLTLA